MSSQEICIAVNRLHRFGVARGEPIFRYGKCFSRPDVNTRTVCAHETRLGGVDRQAIISTKSVSPSGSVSECSPFGRRTAGRPRDTIGKDLGLPCLFGIFVAGIEKNPAECNDGVGVRTRWIRHKETQVCRRLGRGKCGCTALFGRLDEAPLSVLEDCHLQSQLAGELVAHVAD